MPVLSKLATTDRVVAQVTSSPTKSHPLNDVTNQELLSGAIKSSVSDDSAVDELFAQPCPSDDEEEVESSPDEEEDDHLDATDRRGIEIEEKFASKNRKNNASTKHLSRQERRKVQLAAEKTAASRVKAAAAKQAAKAKRRSQLKKTAFCFSSDLIESVNPSLASILPMEAKEATVTPAPGRRGAKIIGEEEYLKCTTIACALPCLEYIRMDANQFAVLQECIVLLPEVPQPVIQEGISVRVARFIGGLAARAVAFVKKVAKKVQHLVGF